MYLYKCHFKGGLLFSLVCLCVFVCLFVSPLCLFCLAFFLPPCFFLPPQNLLEPICLVTRG